MEAKLSIWSGYYGEFKIEDAIEEFIKDGIFASELSHEHGEELLARSSDRVATGRALRAFLEEKGFDLSQGHLRLHCHLCTVENAVEGICEEIDLYEAIGIRNMVLHPDMMEESGLSRDERIERNIAALRRISEYIKDKKDVTICLENLRPEKGRDSAFEAENRPFQGIDDLLLLIDAVDTYGRFGICLDTGHLNLTEKNQRAFIEKAGSRLHALHIANNDGTADHHNMPFARGNVNFYKVAEGLRTVDYHGLYSLEIGAEAGGVPLSLRHEKAKFIKAAYHHLFG